MTLSGNEVFAGVVKATEMGPSRAGRGALNSTSLEGKGAEGTRRGLRTPGLEVERRIYALSIACSRQELGDRQGDPDGAGPAPTWLSDSPPEPERRGFCFLQPPEVVVSHGE